MLKKSLKITLVILSLIIVSCSSKKEYDLSEVRMPYSIDNLVNDKFETRFKENLDNVIARYTSEDPKLLVFDDISFEKEFSAKYFSPTTLEFYADSTSTHINYIALKTSVVEDSNDLYTALLEKFGKPKYYNKDTAFFNGLWQVDNTYFVFKQSFNSAVGGEKSIRTKLMIIDVTKDELVNRFLSIDFDKYKKYLKELAKQSDKSNFSYENFVKSQEEEGYKNKYQEEIDNNLPL